MNACPTCGATTGKPGTCDDCRDNAPAIDLDAMTAAYVECALWSSTYQADDNGDPATSDDTYSQDIPMDDNFDADDIAPETLDKMREDVEAFASSNATLMREYLNAGQSSEQAGHDFWLTRNGHGAGFWDRGLGDLGRALTDAAQVYGSFDLYIGDDGKVYGS